VLTGAPLSFPKIRSAATEELPLAESTRQRGERLQIMLNPEELDAVGDFRFKERMPQQGSGSTRAA
jgi:hypothetical protein